MYKVSLLAIFLTMSFMVSEVLSVENNLLSLSRKVVKQFGAEMKGELRSSLKTGGPLNAISVCSQKAPAIADSISQRENLKIGRTSLRTRNPDNAPDIWEQKTLESFVQRSTIGEDVGEMEHYEVMTLDGQKVFRYMKAIPAGEPCLTCHGQQIQPDLKAELDILYPKDLSTGFALGEIIGAFSIRIPM